MTDLNTNLSKQEFNALLHFETAAQIIKERDKPDGFKSLPQHKKFLLSLIVFINAQVTDLEDTIELMNTVFVSDNIIQHLRNLRTLLRFQKEEDHSQQIEYALKLSKSWHGILNYYDMATTKDMRQEAYEKIGKLIDLFNRYPTPDEHSIGHYLTLYAGENWLPFPFMEIVKDFYDEYLEKGAEAKLSIIIRLITNIMESFNAAAIEHEQG